ncbi:MAG: helix-turn-helix transcriptional regulator [Actinomycetota bacterium]
MNGTKWSILMDEEHARQFGRFMARARADKGLTAKTLGQLTGVDASTIVRIENGKIASPRPETIASMAEALSLPAADVFARAGYTSPTELPDVTAYMRTRFKGLPEEAAQKIARYATRIARQHSIDPTREGTGGDAEP